MILIIAYAKGGMARRKDGSFPFSPPTGLR
jgi:hypothetical protein